LAASIETISGAVTKISQNQQRMYVFSALPLLEYSPPLPFIIHSGFRSDQVSLLCDAQRQIASHCEVCKKNQEKIFLDSAKLQDEVRLLGKKMFLELDSET
jgi:hypothetical protein